MVRTQITELDELTGAIIEGAGWCDDRYMDTSILLLLDGDRYVIIQGSHGDYPDADPYPYLGKDGLLSLYRDRLINLGLVDDAGLKEIERQAKTMIARREQRERDADLATLERLKEKYE